jgi:drug/metabolite transporter (DMT)-like permease
LTWITAALIAAATLAVVNVVDSHLIARRMPSLWAFLIPAGALHLVFGLIFMSQHPLPPGVGAFDWFVVAVAAVTRVAAAFLMLYAMRTEEVSRIIPVVNSYPVLVAIMAVPLLGEVLNGLQWAAIVITVAGAVLISLRSGAGGGGVRLRRSFVLLLGSSLLFAVTNIATKYSLGYVSFWNMYWITALCFGTGFVLFALRPGVWSELRSMEGRRTALAVIACNEAIALGGIIISFWAMQNGPISLVSTVLGVRPLFVFLVALALSVALPAVLDERLGRRIVALKLVSIALIVGGIAIINVVA